MFSSISLSILNLTESHISAAAFNPEAPSIRLTSNSPVTVGRIDIFNPLSVTLTTNKEKFAGASWTIVIGTYVSSRRSWEYINTEGAPWRVYRFIMTQSHHRLLLIPNRPLSQFLAALPSSLPLSSLCLPGTHDTMALYGWPFSQCQEQTLSEQLELGIRVLDIRIAVVDGDLLAYHGSTPQRVAFSSILAVVCGFLASKKGSTETVVMSIMQEDSFVPTSPLFSGLVRDAIFSPPSRKSMWFLENRVPTLGEVRGKIVMFSRFGQNGEGWDGGLQGIGIHPTTWPNSRREGFQWELPHTRVRTQDWYNIPSFLSIPEKTVAAIEPLRPVKPPNGKADLAITFLSAASIPLALPSTCACGFGWSGFALGVEGINSRVGRWLLGQLGGEANTADMLDNEDWDLVDLETGHAPTSASQGKSPAGEVYAYERAVEDVRVRGWVLMDYIDSPPELGIIPLLVECNWRGRVSGEEGWIAS